MRDLVYNCNVFACVLEDHYEATDNNHLTEHDCYEEFPEGGIPKAPPTPPLPPPPMADSDTSSEASSSPALPAEAMTAAAIRSSATKHGPLYRKDRFIFMEQFRRCWAAVSSRYLFIFGSDKDSKPLVTHLLFGYEARPLIFVTKELKKKGVYFELVGPGRKTHQVCSNIKFILSDYTTIYTIDLPQVSCFTYFKV
jgi:hypothetical protein